MHQALSYSASEEYVTTIGTLVALDAASPCFRVYTRFDGMAIALYRDVSSTFDNPTQNRFLTKALEEELGSLQFRRSITDRCWTASSAVLAHRRGASSVLRNLASAPFYCCGGMRKRNDGRCLLPSCYCVVIFKLLTSQSNKWWSCRQNQISAPNVCVDFPS